MNRPAITLIAVAAAVAVIVAGFELREIRSTRTETPAQALAPSVTPFTSGVAPATALPGGGNSVAAVLSGGTLAVIGFPPGATELKLYTVDTAHPGAAITVIGTGLPAAGTSAAIAASANGDIWIGQNDAIVQVSGGSVRRLALPRPQVALPPQFRGPPAPLGLPPTEDGQVTALAWSRAGLLIGRLGYAELTLLDPTTSLFTHIAMPAGVGDATAMAAGPGGSVLFTVNHSGVMPGLLNDAIGIFDPSGRTIYGVSLPAKVLAANATHLARAGYGLGVIDGTGAPVGQPSPGTAYDLSRVAIRTNDEIVVRVAGNSHQVAFIALNGRETKRVEYAAVLGTDGRGTSVPYSSAFTFAVVDPSNAVWFGLFGRPELYRVE